MLEAKNIHKTYSNGKKKLEVLRGIDLKIARGQFVAIVGPSGAGKSTLLHILGGLDEPTRGTVLFEGEDLYRLDDRRISGLRNTRIGFVFQFYHLLPEFTVLENVCMPSLIKTGAQGRKAGVKEKALGLLQEVGLEDRSGHFLGELSGGERQRAAIVRALMNEPDLLLCDEPTGNLDSKSGEEIASLIKNINHIRQMAVVLVTHNPELVRAAGSVYHLKDGILVN